MRLKIFSSSITILLISLLVYTSPAAAQNYSANILQQGISKDTTDPLMKKPLTKGIAFISGYVTELTRDGISGYQYFRIAPSPNSAATIGFVAFPLDFSGWNPSMLKYYDILLRALGSGMIADVHGPQVFWGWAATTINGVQSVTVRVP